MQDLSRTDIFVLTWTNVRHVAECTAIIATAMLAVSTLSALITVNACRAMNNWTPTTVKTSTNAEKALPATRMHIALTHLDLSTVSAKMDTTVMELHSHSREFVGADLAIQEETVKWTWTNAHLVFQSAMITHYVSTSWGHTCANVNLASIVKSPTHGKGHCART